MPIQPKRPCSIAGCPGFAVRGSRCEKHSQEMQRYQDSQRESPSKRGYDRDWKVLREQHLRYHPYCIECKTTHQLEVDHIIPHKGDYRLLRDPNNLQTLCHRCHSRKTLRERSMSMTKVIIISGPPASGKTTYVKSEMVYGDMIVDFDLIGEALSMQPIYNRSIALWPFIEEARKTIIDRLTRKNDLNRAWIIGSYPRIEDRRNLVSMFNDVKSWVFAVSPDECKKRIRADERRKEQAILWDDRIDKWWRNYEEWNRDEVYGSIGWE